MNASNFGHAEIVEMLLAVEGVKVNWQDSVSFFPLVHHLLSMIFRCCCLCSFLYRSIYLRFSLLYCFQQLGTALIKASSRGHPKVVERLLAYPGIEVNLQNKVNNSLSLCKKVFC